ncbi:hypothetical protein SCUCBS95973_003209 [Sporothrix curviconia]|uniref:Uncharacterized protein n=1 Tax=Sporothrix curviconia TaxID=1260050 RepID=A0ABP0BDB5_9PEZI
MDRFNDAKADFPAAYATNGLMPPQKSKARRISAAIAKTALALIFTGLALALIYQVIHDKQAYDSLLSKYNDLVSEQERQPTPQVTLVHRAVNSATPSFVYTTTTVTQGTTITIETVAPSSSFPSSSAASSSMSSTSVSSELCTAGALDTVTVTVTADALASSSTDVSSSAAPSSDAGAVTVMETRVTTATIFVTASGLVSPKAETLTITATATATEFATAGVNNTSFGTSTSTAEGVKGPSMVPSSQNHHTYFPNSTTIIAGYGTTGVAGDLTSTASYTLTVPPGVGPTGTGKLTSPPGTSTSQADPVGTVVTVSGAGKTAATSFGLLLAAAVAVFFT